MRAPTSKVRTRPPALVTGIVLALVLGVGVQQAASYTARNASHAVSPIAAAARSISLNDSATLHLLSHQGSQILNEQGTASGTLRGPLTARIVINYTQATVTFTAHPPGGTFTGTGVESYYVSGKIGHFNGRMTVTHGTGAYAHASATNLHVTGTIKRTHYEVLMQVSGELQR